MITTSFKLTEKELYESLVEVSKSRGTVKSQKIIGVFLFLIMIFVTVINIINDNFVISFGFLFPVVLSLAMIFIAEITAKIQVPSLLKTKDRFTENMKVELNSEKFILTGESFNVQMTLEKLHSVVESKKYFLLKISEGSANVIPKRALLREDVVLFKSIVSSVSGLKVKFKKSN